MPFKNGRQWVFGDESICLPEGFYVARGGCSTRGPGYSTCRSPQTPRSSSPELYCIVFVFVIVLYCICICICICIVTEQTD